PYSIMPQFTAVGSPQKTEGLDWQFTTELSNFRHPTLVNGQRFIAYPSIDFPMRRSYGFIVPKVGFHFTRYNLQDNSEGLDNATRAVPISSLDAGLYFDRPTSWGGRA